MNEKNKCGYKHDEHADRRSKVIVRTVFAEVCVVNQNGTGRITAPDKERSAEVRERAHKHDERRRQNSRHGQRHEYVEKTIDSFTAHALRSFHKRAIYIAESAVHINHHERKKLQSLYEHDTAETVNRDVRNTEGLQYARYKSVIAHKQNPCVCADKGRGHRTEQAHHKEEFPAAQIEKRIKIREGYAEQKTAQHHCRSNFTAVEYRRIIIIFCKKTGKRIERKAAVYVRRFTKQSADRIDKK